MTMTADDARLMTRNSDEGKLAVIEKMIRKACNEGKYEISFDWGDLTQNVIDRLKDNGFKVAVIYRFKDAPHDNEFDTITVRVKWPEEEDDE